MSKICTEFDLIRLLRRVREGVTDPELIEGLDDTIAQLLWFSKYSSEGEDECTSSPGETSKPASGWPWLYLHFLQAPSS